MPIIIARRVATERRQSKRGRESKVEALLTVVVITYFSGSEGELMGVESETLECLHEE